MKLENQNIIITSNEPWGDVWYSKQHWAHELSLHNKVFFLNPPERWSLQDLFNSKISYKEESSSLEIINYNNRLPFTRFRFIFKLNEYIVTRTLKRWFKVQNFCDYIFWSFDPFRFSSPKLLAPKVSIFYITDLFYNKEEKRIIKNVDYVFAVNKTLLDRFPSYNKNMFVIPHGISNIPTGSDEKMANQIILTGTFTDRINLQLLERISTTFPKTIITLYGPILFKKVSNTSKFKEIIESENVNYLGFGSMKNIEIELKKSKIAIAIYLNNNLGNRLNSLKIIQYMSYGKNIVTSFFEDYENLSKEGLIEMTDDEDLFIEKCAILLNKEESTILNEKRIKYAEKYLYSTLINSIEKIIN